MTNLPGLRSYSSPDMHEGSSMGFTADILADVRRQITPDDAALKEARQRRDATLAAAGGFEGVLETFSSGSIAHGTANCPIHLRDKGLDADCGVRLDRRFHRTLGPDSDQEEGPGGVVERLRVHVRSRLKADYPDVAITITKRALLVRFHSPLPTGEDPSADLVAGLERKDAPGLWIPNTERERWDPSHPQRHTEMLTADPKEVRVTRARAIRLAKAENKRTATGPLCSFNIEAFGLMFVEGAMAEPEALLALWSQGAKDLRRRLTPDPAKVSGAIKVADRDRAVHRLEVAAGALKDALEHDDDEPYVRKALAPLWPDYVATAGGDSKARIAATVRAGESLSFGRTGLSGSPAASTGVALTKRPRSYGDAAG
ncbi:hypothetical protein LQ327_28245 [Actinomycetospora endophytica]|uniref:Nucleotidyltransferase n=1 Tax=Actinomycetospora endophytica TaxID=2291215 RepID=A0ABS8PGG3_9PSEU|nr:hypothetical protein [Actinomycetospora endophytica]MCD2197269.1 hypothetical protein [Actinomycetospora endophytica]